MPTTILVEQEGPIGRLTLNRPESLNAINTVMVAELTEAAAWFNDRPDIRAVVISGAGRVFSAGADLAEGKHNFDSLVAGDFDEQAALAQARAGAAMTDAIEAMRAVTLAAVHGVAIGGAVALLAACDLKYLATGTRLLLPEVEMGIPLAWGATARLVRDLGNGVVRDMLLTGRSMGAEEAVAKGFAAASLPPDDLVAQVLEQAEGFTGRPARAVAIIKSRLSGRADGEDEAVSLVDCMQDPESISATSSYLGALKK